MTAVERPPPVSTARQLSTPRLGPLTRGVPRANAG